MHTASVEQNLGGFPAQIHSVGRDLGYGIVPVELDV
jgi:hypothetical protein